MGMLQVVNLLLIVFSLAGCTSSPAGEKLTVAPGAQIIGDTVDGGGIERVLAAMVQVMTPGMESDNETESEPGGESETDLEDESATEPEPGWGPLADELDDESLDESEPLPRSPDEEPDAGDFGELGVDGEWASEGNLEENEAPPNLDEARVWKFGAYRAYVWRGKKFNDNGFALYHHGTLSDVRSGRFYMTAPEPDDDDDLTTVKGPAPGADIDGNGIPDLLLYEFSGGAHCCWTTMHIECGERPLLRAEIHTWHSQPVFADLDGDGRAEVRFADTSYAYWHECFADSPFPTVVLRIRDGHYEMAGEIMRAQGPSADEVAEQTRKIGDLDRPLPQASGSDASAAKNLRKMTQVWEDRPLQMWGNGVVGIPSSVWGMMLDLIYSGRSQEALTFVDAVWPQANPAKRTSSWTWPIRCWRAGSAGGCRGSENSRKP